MLFWVQIKAAWIFAKETAAIAYFFLPLKNSDKRFKKFKLHWLSQSFL